MLALQFGGDATQEFVDMLSEDHGEVLREGDHGDEMVSAEDHLITSSLKGRLVMLQHGVGGPPDSDS